MYEPRKQGAECDACPLNSGVPVPLQEGRDPYGIVVGEGPWHTEVRKGYPFAGESGRLLDLALRRAGLDRARLRVFNVMACEPITKSERELAAASKCCEARMGADLSVPGKESLPVLAVGAYAVRALTVGNSVDEERGFARPLRSDIEGLLRPGVDSVVLSTVHPARVLRDPTLKGRFFSDVGKFARIAKGEKPALSFKHLPIYDEDYYCHNRIVDEGEPVAIDIETDGIRVDTASPTYISFGNTKEAVSFNLIRWDLRSLLAELVDKQLIFANGFDFDLPILRRYGFEPKGKIEDIRDLRRTIAADSPLSLGYMASLYELVFPWKVGADTQNPYYNAMDALMTARVHAKMRAEAERR